MSPLRSATAIQNLAAVSCRIPITWPQFFLTDQDAAGNEIAQVKGDGKGWNFRFLDQAGNELGTITKKWAGIGKELFTSADNYILALNQEPTPAQATLLLAAALAVDIIYKER